MLPVERRADFASVEVRDRKQLHLDVAELLLDGRRYFTHELWEDLAAQHRREFDFDAVAALRHE